ncbi:MAG: hypothetical protein ABGX83_08455 [Nitrospira sp.]|nr:hypothetical protein [Candidatus Manganitrophaceae bacterium]
MKPASSARALSLMGILLVLALVGCSDISNPKIQDITATKGLDGDKATIFVANTGDGSLIAFDPQQFNLTGTVAVTNNDVGIVGFDTRFTNELAPGNTFQVGGQTVRVLNIINNTNLTLTAPFPGTTTSGLSPSWTNVQGNVLPLVSEGNIAPSRRFPKSMVGPMGLFLDIDSTSTPPRNTLYVANANGNSIDIFEDVDTQNFDIGLAIPTRSISGRRTRLDHPFAVSYDATNNRLYVANRDGSSILRFNDTPIPSLKGDITPSGVLAGFETTTIFFPRGIAVDTGRDILYISNVGNDSILVYDNASNAGGLPAVCFSVNQDPPLDVSLCKRLPDRQIAPHDDLGPDPSAPDPNKIAGQLDIPFGIFMDEGNNRLYVANTGFNQPGILIYENASTRDGTVFPERVILTNNDLLPLECTPTEAIPFPEGCNTSQFGVPTGVAFDTVNNVLYVVNNNNANNINLPESGNIDSTAILAFSDPIASIDDLTKCPATTGPTPTKVCALPPDRRLGGDVTSNENSLTNPVSIAIDPDHGAIYVSNPGADNILTFALDGNINPFKINSGNILIFDKEKTHLESPSGFFYDKALDRLFISNFTSKIQTPNLQITVYDDISTKSFSSTAPSWSLQGLNIASPKGVYVDKGREKLLILSTSGLKTGLVIYDLDTITGFPTNTNIGPAGTTLLLPTSPPPTILSAGLTSDGPTAMAVTGGDVYIADKGNNRIIIFNLDDPAKNRTISSSVMDRPSGLFIDTIRDILYVTNVGNNNVLAFDMASSKNSGPGPTFVDILPDRTLSIATLSDPIAPVINMNLDRLFLISRRNNSILVFDEASTLDGTTNPNRTISGDKTRLDFAHLGFFDNGTGALLFHDRGNGETLFVGQPVGVPNNPICSTPSFECPRGAFLAFGTEGKLAPSRIFSGGDPALSTPASIALDIVNDILFVADQGDNEAAGDDSIMIISGASTLDSNISSTPPTNITKFTNANLLNNPAGLFIDVPNNRLYIANSGGTIAIPGFLSVQVDSSVVTGRGTSFETGPDRLFPGDIITINNKSVTVAKIKDDLTLSLVSRWTAPTHLDDPTGIPGPIGYVSKCSVTAPATPCNILVFDDADLLGQGTPSPSSLSITNPALIRPHGLTVGPTGIVYVANTGGDSVLIFDNIGALKTTLAGDLTQIGRPVNVAFDATHDFLYVLNLLDQEILVFAGVSTMTGAVNISPARVISPVNKGIIASIDPNSDTQFTLTAPYTGRTATGMTYGREGDVFSETTTDFFLFGKINVTNGSTTVTGNEDTFLDGILVKGTLFRTQLKVGDTIQVGTSLFTRPTGLFLDTANDLLYVTDQVANAVHIFNNASLAEGDAEHRSIIGDNTGLRQPRAITVNPKTP